MQEICELVPAFNREINNARGKGTQFQKDYVKVLWKNKSYFDNVAARESSRGKRRHGGVVEECVGVDGKILNEVIIPTMNIDRQCADGTFQESETLNKSQIFITTAGYKNTYPYDKLIQILVRSILEPDKAIILGGTWRIPVLVGLQSKSFVSDLKRDGTFNETSFDREYESRWSGSSDDSFFNAELFDKNRIINLPENEFSKKSAADGYYILSVDVGRKSDNSVITVIKVSPKPNSESLKRIVNIYSYEQVHFEEQSIYIKKLAYLYKVRRVVIDTNGIGVGLMDYLVKSQIDESTGEYYPSYGVYNDEDGIYKKFRKDDTVDNMIYTIKATPALNTIMHSNLQEQLNSGRVKFLITEQEAKAKLMETSKGKAMSHEQRAEYLRPYVLTSILKEEMLNLKEQEEGVNIILKQVNKKIKKDKVSSLEYGLHYIKAVEEDKRRRKKFNAKDWMFFS